MFQGSLEIPILSLTVPVKAAYQVGPNPSNEAVGVAKSFKMMEPTHLKSLLSRGLGPKVKSVM